IPSIKMHTNKDAFIRIIDNILSNAGKYNSADGHVNIVFENHNLLISDTGKGIKNISKVFDRYYKEQDRGIGIGLHIVKKLCDELMISIHIQSKQMKGTKITLDLTHVLV
ncbi:MAG: sensor histidine kinase, partial [Sulfurovum sp.]